MTNLETLRWESETVYARAIDRAAEQGASAEVLCELLVELELRPVSPAENAAEVAA